jgi:hypothetical protein
VSGYLPDGSISLTSSILWALPATVPQLADKFYSSDNIITMLLCRLRERGSWCEPIRSSKGHQAKADNRISGTGFE